MPTREHITSNLIASFESFGAVVDGLADRDWLAQSLCPSWNVRGVVEHVAAVEQILVGWTPDQEQPFGRLEATLEEFETLDPSALRDRYHELVAVRRTELTAMTDADFDTPSFTPVGHATYGRFMAIRNFDVWVHERDIRVPLGVAGNDGGPAAEMALDEVDHSLGYIVGKKIGLPDGMSIEFDLTGPVTRAMFVDVDGRAKRVDHVDDPTVTLRTDSLTFMLLACGRIDPQGPIDDGRVTWTGDSEWGERAARNLAFTM